MAVGGRGKFHDEPPSRRISLYYFQVCVAFGLTYNGLNSKNQPKWDGCANVKLWTFENATTFAHYISSFNINTNNWCAEYIYKRLRFLGSKLYSQLGTLFFLALWHGFHSGYYFSFFQEFIIMYFEKDVSLHCLFPKKFNHPHPSGSYSDVPGHKNYHPNIPTNRTSKTKYDRPVSLIQ